MGLILHTGAKPATRTELALIEPPPPTQTWFPTKHLDVLDLVTSMLELSQFNVASERLGLSADGHKFFGTLKLRNELVPGVKLTIGVRNSTDQTFPLGFCAGETVFVCDNTAFSAELIVNRRHTKNGGVRFREATSLAVQNLVQFQAAETKRIEYLQTTTLARYEAEALMLHAFEQGILSSRILPLAIEQFRNPQFDWGPRDRYWHLMNAMTTPMQSRATSNPQQFALTTMKLVALMSPKEVGFDQIEAGQDSEPFDYDFERTVG